MSADRNANSCTHCHVKDGRGITQANDFRLTGFSVSNPKNGEAASIYRHPAASAPPQGKLEGVDWRLVRTIELPGRFKVDLVVPEAIVDGFSTHVELRTSPGVYGLGLLEAIPDAELRELVRRRPYLRFGVKGRLGEIAKSEGTLPQIGRFGWKASFASLDEQVVAALASELGIGKSQSAQEAPQLAATVADLTAYLRSIAVPARDRESVDRSKRGARLFSRVGCAMCHTPSWNRVGVAGLKERLGRAEKIYPFTDLLLHDMGPGLRANNSDPLSAYWRTPALWGIGLQASVSPQSGFLHDGRGRTVLEAILWHAGEAQYSIARFESLSQQDRDDLLSFLSSL
ncbi:di-heme oxidoredictase family protein [Variovorax sp. LT1R20]|uniref:di-heme oxidoredictase family protein n=1 Tax=Variovorax sp. LT1R20 TaxID=3443729 RepID=UPI003F48335F